MGLRPDRGWSELAARDSSLRLKAISRSPRTEGRGATGRDLLLLWLVRAFDNRQ